MSKLLIPAFVFVLVCYSFRDFQSISITGKVTDEQGNAIYGATVKEVGVVNATSTKTDGSYIIKVRDRNSVLEFSSVGFKTEKVKVKDKTVLDIQLKIFEGALQEVVVIGYDTQKRSSVVGSTTVLQGKVPGIRVNGGSYTDDFNTEEYDRITENAFHKVTDDPLSTFSIDVDAASYSNMRRYLNQGQLPPADAVRIEEMINYFSYEYPQPQNSDPFSINTEIGTAPWNPGHKLVMIGLQGKKIPMENLPPSNLVFLIDVSGSMSSPMKLSLVKSSMKLLVDQLREEDKISIVVYAGAAGLVLPSTSGFNKVKIKSAIDNLEAGGSTAGGAGIRLAYKVAKENFMTEGNNRIILCTDGDFNVGVSSNGEMERLVEKEREDGVFLTVLGYGMGNYKDSKMQILADKGNGNHAYIDSESEAKKVLVSEFGGTLFTIAKDVKLQIEFNPEKVQGYRLIGYENRMLNKEDFNDDKKDAGELGSGHTVTALYEVIPVGVKSDFLKDVDPLKYQKQNKKSKALSGNEILTVKFRYKEPKGGSSKLITHPLQDSEASFENTSDNFRFAVAVAEFGMLLRNSEFKSASSFDQVAAIAEGAKGKDMEGYRKEFLMLVKKAKQLSSEGLTKY